MKLLLVRHGQTPANLVDTLDTLEPGPGLTDLGRSQAEALVETLAHHDIDRIFTSNLRRTQLTAGPISTARGLELNIRPGIREIQAGRYEGSTDVDHIAEYVEVMRRWSEGDLAAAVAGAPDGHRTIAAFDEVVAEAESTRSVLVSHAAIIWAWCVARAHNIDHDFASTHLVANTGVVELEGSTTSGWEVTSWQGIIPGR